MEADLALWSLVLLCFAMAGAIGGGLCEHIVVIPIWSASPPSSFAIIQPGTGVPLQRFWIPVPAAITIFILTTLPLTWTNVAVRRLLLIGVASYIVMRAWSGLFFIREMLAFQKFPLIRFRRQSSGRESRGGRIGRGSESRSTSSHSRAFCWLSKGCGPERTEAPDWSGQRIVLRGAGLAINDGTLRAAHAPSSRAKPHCEACRAIAVSMTPPTKFMAP